MFNGLKNNPFAKLHYSMEVCGYTGKNTSKKASHLSFFKINSREEAAGNVGCYSHALYDAPCRSHNSFSEYKTQISKRIWITRYVLVIGIVILHLPPYEPLNAIDNSLFSFIKAFFAHGLFRATVPVLTVLSGYLLFSSDLHLRPLKLLLKKTTSLFLPLVLWNIPVAIVIFISQKYNLLSYEFSAKLYPIDLLNWLNAITGALACPVNYPLNFLRDLFVISILSPLFWPLLKKAPYYGLLFVFIVYYFDFDGALIQRSSMLVNFYLGALAAGQHWDLTCLDGIAKQLFCILIAICSVIVLFRIENREFFRLISPFLVWPAIKLISDSRLGDLIYKYSGNSFFTFLSHSMIILSIWIVFQETALVKYYYVYWFLTPPITVVISVLLCRYLKIKFPRLSTIMLGGRS